MQERVEELDTVWKELVEALKNISNDGLAFLKAANRFRKLLDVYVSEQGEDAMSQEDLFQFLDRLTEIAPVDLSRESFTDLEELSLKMYEYGRNPEYFSGENNPISQEYNSTFSIIHVITGIASRKLGIQKEEELKKIRDEENPNCLTLPHQFHALIFATKSQENRHFLQQINSIISNEEFWSDKSIAGITGINKIKKILSDKDIPNLTDAEVINLFMKITSIAKKRIEPRGFFSRLFSSKRNPDTEDFYGAILKAANYNPYNPSNPFERVYQKMENQAPNKKWQV